MGFDPVSLAAMATAAIGSGTAATGATVAAGAASAATAGSVATGLGAAAAAGSAATGTLGAGLVGASEVAGGLATAATAGGATAGLSASTLASLGASAITAGVGIKALGAKAPKPPGSPQAPSMFGASSGSTSLIGSAEGTANGTFLTGNNRSPQISGGKKTLLGQ